MILRIEIKGKIREILTRRNIQIFTLDTIPQRTRNQFIFGKSSVVVVFDQVTLAGRLHDLKDGKYSVETKEEVPIHVKKGDNILVVLPEGSNRRYIIQGEILNRFVNSVEFHILDPRSHERFNVQSRSMHVDIYTISEEIAQGLLNNHLILLRDINFGVEKEKNFLSYTKEEGPGGEPKEAETKTQKEEKENDQEKEEISEVESSFEYKAIDVCIDKKTRDIHPSFKKLLDSPPQSKGTIFDISKGGMCIILEEKDISIDQGSLLIMDTGFLLDQSLSFHLTLLGIVRGKSPLKEGSIRLHVMFLKPLPERAQGLFREHFSN